MIFLYHAHSGLRYLVLLVGLLAVLYLAFGLLTRRAFDGPARGLAAAFTGLLDLQMVFGILLLFFRPFYPALIGHVVTMLLAIAAAHGFSVAARKAADPRRRYGLALTGVALALLLIAGGIMSIGRGVFETTVGS
ncbi:MAG: hypothetical protein ABW277_12465 [Longimicrobiaceae bacterium]